LELPLNARADPEHLELGRQRLHVAAEATRVDVRAQADAVGGGAGEGQAAVDRDREHPAARIVGVLADQVDAAGGVEAGHRPDPATRPRAGSRPPPSYP